MIRHRTSMAICALLLTQTCGAAGLPLPSPHDPHIGRITYREADVAIIPVQRGTVTRIILGQDEKILAERTATGFQADCAKPELEWCIHAHPGGNQILIKPSDGATANNIELSTNRHDYSFALRVLSDPPGRSRFNVGTAAVQQPMYRVIFDYPNPAPQLVRAGQPNQDGAGSLSATRAAPTSAEPPLNWAYTMQQGPGSGHITPSLVFDDGRFTYFRFPFSREMPTIFAVSPQGEESRVNFHIDALDQSLIGVQRTAQRFVLRLGTAAIGVWNEAPPADGSAPVGGSTVPGTIRVMREHHHE